MVRVILPGGAEYHAEWYSAGADALTMSLADDLTVLEIAQAFSGIDQITFEGDITETAAGYTRLTMINDLRHMGHGVTVVARKEAEHV